jgi:hypothetical protein
MTAPSGGSAAPWPNDDRSRALSSAFSRENRRLELYLGGLEAAWRVVDEGRTPKGMGTGGRDRLRILRRPRAAKARSRQAGRSDGRGGPRSEPPPHPPPPPRAHDYTRAPPAPAPAPTPATAPVGGGAAAAVPTGAAPDAKPPEERKTLTTLGIGPTWFLLSPSGGGPRWSSPGVVLHANVHVPGGDHYGLGVRFAWGLTEFRRFEEWAKAGYRIGEWTTNAYKDVYEWAAQKDDARGLRWMGAFFAFVVLWIPYVVAGVAYAIAPISPTTYLEADITFNYDLGSDPKGQGLYFKGGLGLVAFFHPKYDTLHGGIGPTLGMGFRAGSVDLGLHGTYIPPGLHGETRNETSHLFITSLTLGVF